MATWCPRGIKRRYSHFGGPPDTFTRGGRSGRPDRSGAPSGPTYAPSGTGDLRPWGGGAFGVVGGQALTPQASPDLTMPPARPRPTQP
jgi:hypothetical protein